MQDFEKTNVMDWLSLSLIFPADCARLWEMISRSENVHMLVEELLCGSISKLCQSDYLSLKSFRRSYAEDIAGYCRSRNIYILTPDDENYPEKLISIDCPPTVLYCAGDISCLNDKSIAIVGARKASGYSLKLTEIFSGGLAGNGITVVSGFANGIDSAAHTAAIKHGGKTIAVLGCGIDYDYPKGKTAFKKLISEHGAAVSEYPPFTAPKPDNFRVRNRIISALTDGVLVMQASKKSGSLNTVSHALLQGRDVYVVPPHDLMSDMYQGQISLLKDGATEVYFPRDILINMQKNG